MAISKESVRVQFTLNTSRKKEKLINEFLNDCINPNNSIKEIIYNYIVSNGGTKSPQVTQMEVTQSNSELPKVSNSDDINKNKVSNGEERLLEVSELEMNELEELNKFF